MPPQHSWEPWQLRMTGQLCFLSWKLSKTQQKYSVTKIELLAIMETLKEFKVMPWGQCIKVFADQKNLSRDALGLTSDRVHQWRLLLEKNIYIRDSKYSCRCNFAARIWSQAKYYQWIHPCNAWCVIRGDEHTRMEISCAPLVMLQWIQCINSKSLHSDKCSFCKSQQGGQNIPSHNQGNCRGSTSQCNPETSL